MKLNKMRVLSLAACLICIFFLTGAYAEDLDYEEDDTSVNIEVDLEAGQEDSDGFLISDNPIITIIMVLATFTDREDEVYWTINTQPLVQTEENTYENRAEDLPDEIIKYEISEGGMDVNLTGKLDTADVKINTGYDGIITKIMLDVSAATEFLIHNCSTKGTKLAKGGKDGEVTLVGFGTFQKVQRKARKGINPFTGEQIQIKAKNTCEFKAGKKLKDAI